VKWILALSIGLSASLGHAASIEPARLRRAEESIRQALFGKALIKEARRHLGKPYVWGAKDGETGFDCSGYTSYVFKTFRVEIPDGAMAQYQKGITIERPALQAGDLVFFVSTSPDASMHVGIYNGEGGVLHAPGDGQVLKVSPFKEFEKRYIGARRYLPDKPATKEKKP
jgi:peptidoglycan DL-endopeptidase CwlO